MTDFIYIIMWVTGTMSTFFLLLDSIYVADSGFTILDWFLAAVYLDIIIWFIKALLSMESDEGEEDTSKSGGYDPPA